MNDREALAAALDVFFAKRNAKEWDTIEGGAQKYLAQLPETCGTCGGSGKEEVPECFDHTHTKPNCPSCHGRGTMYPQALVERVLLALPFYLSEVQLIAVLDALYQFPAPEEV